MFNRDYKVRYCLSKDDGETFHPDTMVINTSSAHNAQLKAEDILWQEGIPSIYYVEAIS